MAHLHRFRAWFADFLHRNADAGYPLWLISSTAKAVSGWLISSTGRLISSTESADFLHRSADFLHRKPANTLHCCHNLPWNRRTD